MSERYYVQIDRDDGSRTYKGAWTRAHCEREAQAWREDMPHYTTTIVSADIARPDFKAWSRTIREGHRYYPTDDGTELLGSQALPRYPARDAARDLHDAMTGITPHTPYPDDNDPYRQLDPWARPRSAR